MKYFYHFTFIIISVSCLTQLEAQYLCGCQERYQTEMEAASAAKNSCEYAKLTEKLAMCSLNCNEVDEKTKTTIRELLPKLRAEIQKECTGKNTDGENNEKNETSSAGEVKQDDYQRLGNFNNKLEGNLTNYQNQQNNLTNQKEKKKNVQKYADEMMSQEWKSVKIELPDSKKDVTNFSNRDFSNPDKGFYGPNLGELGSNINERSIQFTRDQSFSSNRLSSISNNILGQNYNSIVDLPNISIGKIAYNSAKIAFEHIFGVDLTIVDKLESQLEEPLNIYDFVVNKVFPEAIKVWSIDPNSLDPIPTISFKEYMQNWAKSFMPAGSANGLSWAMQ